jgi:hypothetical protein
VFRRPKQVRSKLPPVFRNINFPASAAAVSLAWIGDFEIRRHAAPPTSAVKQPLFIIDIFDHDAQLFIDSRTCYAVAEGAVAFDEFLRLAEPVTDATHEKPPV